MKRITAMLAAAVMGWGAAVAAGPITSPSQAQQQQPQPGQQVNGELYGNNAPVNLPRYGPQSEPLPSETRFAIERSGVLPSELRMAAEAYGPLAPNGVASYLPTQSAIQEALRSRPLNVWGPAYGPQQQIPSAGTPSPQPQPGVPGYGATDRKSDLPPSPQYIEPQMVQPQVVQSGYRLSNNPNQFRGEGVTTMRILPRTRLATPPPTQPTTQPTPSLSGQK
jgi:hypothetical protein